MGEAVGYIVPNGTVSVLSADGEVVSVEPPAHVDLEVAETDPGLKGDTATGGQQARHPGDRGRGAGAALRERR